MGSVDAYDWWMWILNIKKYIERNNDGTYTYFTVWETQNKCKGHTEMSDNNRVSNWLEYHFEKRKFAKKN